MAEGKWRIVLSCRDRDRSAIPNADYMHMVASLLWYNYKVLQDMQNPKNENSREVLF